MLLLNKILPIIVLPLGLALVLLAVGAWKRRWGPVFAAFVTLYFFSIPWTADRLESWLEARYTAIPIEQAEHSDAIVMLSGVFGPPVSDGYVLNMADSSERLEGSILLWQHHKAPWLVFTCGKMPWEASREPECVVSSRVSVTRGIPAEQIVTTSEVGNTADEAKEVARLMRERAWKKVLLVTSARHMPRAAVQFRKASVNFVPFTVDYHVDPHHKKTLLDFLPCVGSLGVSESVIRELYGSLFYRTIQWFH